VQLVCGAVGVWCSWCVVQLVCGAVGVWCSWCVVQLVCGAVGVCRLVGAALRRDMAHTEVCVCVGVCCVCVGVCVCCVCVLH